MATKPTTSRRPAANAPAPKPRAKAMSATTQTKVAPKPKKAEAPKSNRYPAEAKITVLVKDTPALRGSRAARWPLVAKAKTVGDLAAALKAGDHPQSVGGTIGWLVEAGLVKIG